MLTLIVLLAVLAVTLGLIELFLFPGFGIAGVGAVISAIICVFVVYNCYGLAWSLVTLGGSILLLAFLLRAFIRSKTLERISLKTTIDSQNARPEQLNVKVGDLGTALTRLALIGNAKIGENVVEVKSSGSFINPGKKVKVINVNQALITVEECIE